MKTADRRRELRLNPYARRMLELLISGQYLTFIVMALVLILAIALHEFSHALAADLQGDQTARSAGRLTLNPVRHLDPIGTVALVLVGLGWGKPVPFNPRNLRNARFGPALVALAGPAMNIVLALAFAFIFAATKPRPGGFGEEVLGLALLLNVLLAVFNLIPLPPLDGSRILSIFLPARRSNILYFLDKWGFVILILLILFRILERVLFPVVRLVAGILLDFAAALIP